MKLPTSLPDARTIATQLGAGRVALAALITAAPVLATRALGADTATAQRVTWLARMTAARDGALGAGTLAAARTGGDLRPWLLGAAASDAVDALVLGAAIGQGRIRGFLPRAIVGCAAGGAALGAWAAVRS